MNRKVTSIRRSVSKGLLPGGGSSQGSLSSRDFGPERSGTYQGQTLPPPAQGTHPSSRPSRLSSARSSPSRTSSPCRASSLAHPEPSTVNAPSSTSAAPTRDHA